MYLSLADGNASVRINDGAEEVAWTGIPDGTAIYPAVCFYSNTPTVRYIGATGGVGGAGGAAAGAAAGAGGAPGAVPGAALAPPRPPVMPVEEDPDVIRAR